MKTTKDKQKLYNQDTKNAQNSQDAFANQKEFIGISIINLPIFQP